MAAKERKERKEEMPGIWHSLDAQSTSRFTIRIHPSHLPLKIRLSFPPLREVFLRLLYYRVIPAGTSATANGVPVGDMPRIPLQSGLS